MKAFLSVLLILISEVSVPAQINTDSLQQILQKTSASKENLQRGLDQMQSMYLHQTEEIRLIGEWVIQNTNSASLKEMHATANLILGNAFANVLNFDDATRHLTIALSIAEKNNYYNIQAEVLNTLGNIYNRNELHENAFEYYKKSLNISQLNKYSKGIALAEFNLGYVQLQTAGDNYQRVAYSVHLMRKGYEVITHLKDTQNIIALSSGLGSAYVRLKNYDSANIILEIAEKLIKATGKEVAYVRHYSRVAGMYHHKKNYSEALKYYNKGLAVAVKYNIPRWLCQYYTGLADTYEDMGNYKKANLYNQLNIQMHDALVKEENFIAAADIQNKYERAKKDNEILKLAAVNKQKSTLNTILISSSFGLLLISFLGYMNFKTRSKIAKQQEELQSQKIAELEKDKQLLAIDAMLKGQEEERSRIAKELHDGLGSLLSGTKLSFINVKDNLRLSPENKMQFEKSLSMLDNTISDLRKVAQNLMPETLVKFGLHEALRDFCSSMESSSGIKIFYMHFGVNREMSNTNEVFIYRIIQELVNNAVKHANATEIIAQLTMTVNTISITVEDNGKGFDKNKLMEGKGSGMANIKYRVQYLNGTLDFTSSIGNGTTVNIHLMV